MRRWPKMKTNRNKIIIAIIVAIVVVAGVIFGERFISEKEPGDVETTPAETTVKVTEEVTEAEETTYVASEEIIAEAMSAYEKELSKYDSFTDAYVTDINGDEIPEVFCRTAGIWEEFMMTYTEKGGLSVVLAERHSSMHPEIYISEDNMVYTVDEGHNLGTAFYRSAHIYEINENGFIEKEEIRGKEAPEGLDFTDHGEVFRLSDEYRTIFENDIIKATEERKFIRFSEQAESDDPVEYLKENLSINLKDNIVIE